MMRESESDTTPSKGEKTKKRRKQEKKYPDFVVSDDDYNTSETEENLIPSPPKIRIIATNNTPPIIIDVPEDPETDDVTERPHSVESDSTLSNTSGDLMPPPPHPPSPELPLIEILHLDEQQANHNIAAVRKNFPQMRDKEFESDVALWLRQANVPFQRSQRKQIFKFELTSLEHAIPSSSSVPIDEDDVSSVPQSNKYVASSEHDPPNENFFDNPSESEPFQSSGSEYLPRVEHEREGRLKNVKRALLSHAGEDTDDSDVSAVSARFSPMPATSRMLQRTQQRKRNMTTNELRVHFLSHTPPRPRSVVDKSKPRVKLMWQKKEKQLISLIFKDCLRPPYSQKLPSKQQCDKVSEKYHDKLRGRSGQVLRAWLQAEQRRLRKT